MEFEETREFIKAVLKVDLNDAQVLLFRETALSLSFVLAMPYSVALLSICQALKSYNIETHQNIHNERARKLLDY